MCESKKKWHWTHECTGIHPSPWDEVPGREDMPPECSKCHYHRVSVEEYPCNDCHSLWREQRCRNDKCYFTPKRLNEIDPKCKEG